MKEGEKMNVTLPENKIDKSAIIVYSVIIAICIISIILVIWIQFFEDKTVETIGTLKGKSNYDYDVLKSEFKELFTNKLENDNGNYDNKKQDKSKGLVYTGYHKKENSAENYDIDVNIPFINIKNSTVQKYNQEIEENFISKTESIMNTVNKRNIYSVQYGSYIQDGILSVIIKAEIQEGERAQRTIIETFNYSLEDNKEVSLINLLQQKNVQESYAQNKIDKEIQLGYKKAQDLKSLGHPIFERNLNDEMYKIANATNFYYHDGSIYVVFAYGNEKSTNEVDVAVI